jgi:hypothetical protein
MLPFGLQVKDKAFLRPKTWESRWELFSVLYPQRDALGVIATAGDLMDLG